jgi:hypothetical protein
VGTDAPQQAPDLLVRRCRLCQRGHVSPARLKAGDYRCNRCRSASPSHKAARARYSQKPDRRAAESRRNRKRIYVGQEYHSVAATADTARIVNAHIKERMCHFRETRDRNAS